MSHVGDLIARMTVNEFSYEPDDDAPELHELRRVMEELTRLGEAAVPELKEGVKAWRLRESEQSPDNVLWETSFNCGRVLARMGTPDALRFLLTEHRFYLFHKLSPQPVGVYLWGLTHSDPTVRMKCWWFLVARANFPGMAELPLGETLMKVLEIGRGREFTVREMPIPAPGPGEVLVRVEAVTTCPQWDLHLRHDEPMFAGHAFHYPYTPGQPGHEATGEIAAVGEGVSDVKAGDRVSVWRDPGHKNPGCYAQYAIRKAADVIRVPDGLPAEALAPVELAMCVGATFRMLREMNAVAGRHFGVSGLGPAGLIAAQMARAEGATRVTGFDLTPARREYALSKGIVDGAPDPRAEWEGPKLGGAVDCVGAKASVEALLDRTADVVALFGVQREPYTFAPRHYRNRLCGYPGHSREAAEYAVDLIAAGKLDLAPLVTHHLPLERYAEGIDLLERQEAIKVCFWPWR